MTLKKKIKLELFIKYIFKFKIINNNDYDINMCKYFRINNLKYLLEIISISAHFIIYKLFYLYL